MTTEELENYEPKGNLIDFPKEIIARMLNYQEEQGNPRDISVFEKQCYAGYFYKGFNWDKTQEMCDFWYKVIQHKNFNLFFEIYPKQDYQELKNNKNMQENNKKEEDSQEFKVGDKVIDIITGQKGKIHEINTNDKITYPIYVILNEKDSYTLDGKYYEDDRHPRLLHYRDDYDYDVIDFNNLPKRQEPNRWRAKKDGVYNFVSFYNGCCFFSDVNKDEYNSFDNDKYNSGNYFRTEVEAEIIAQKLNTYFKQLIQEEHEYERN